jgi:hypothetical protein
MHVSRSFVAVACAAFMLGASVASGSSIAHAHDAGTPASQRFVHRVAEGTDGQSAAHSWVLSPAGNARAATAVDARTSARLAVITFTLPSTPSLGTTTAAVRDTYFGTGRSATEFYREASGGTFLLSGDVFGPYALEGVDESACVVDDWAAAARSKASAAGTDLSGFTHVAYVFPSTPACPWAGMAEVGGTASFINGMAAGDMGAYHAIHELGHNFGSGHAHSYRCTDGSASVALGPASGCSIDEYGDPFSVMGNGFIRLPNGWELAQMGLLPAGAVQLIDVEGTQRLRVSPLERASGVRLVRVTRSDGTLLDLAYRQPSGRYDNYASTDPAVRGLSIHLVPADAQAETRLIDATPGTATFDDATLTGGRTFSDPDGGVNVTLVAADGDGATFDVSVVRKAPGADPSPDSSPPLAPGGLVGTVAGDNTVQLSWQPALDNVGVASYRVARDGVLLSDGGGTSYSDAVALQGPATYAVQAVDTAGNAGAQAVVQIQPPDRTAPTAPGALSFRRVGAGSIRVRWGAATDDRGGAIAYEVRLDSRPALRTTNLVRLFSGVARGSHRIVVRAIDAAGNAGPSVRLSARV